MFARLIESMDARNDGLAFLAGSVMLPHAAWPNIAIVFGSLSAISGITLLLS